MSLQILKFSSLDDFKTEAHSYFIANDSSILKKKLLKEILNSLFHQKHS